MAMAGGNAMARGGPTGAANVAPGVTGSAKVQGAGTTLGLTSRFVSNRCTEATLAQGAPHGTAPAGGAVMVPKGSAVGFSRTRMVGCGETSTAVG